METTSGKETITVLRRLIAYAEKIFQLSKDIVTGAVLGQVGQHQCLGTGWAGPLLETLARRADLQRRHPGTSPCGAPCPRVAARDSRRLRAPETEQSLAGYLRPGSRRS